MYEQVPRDLSAGGAEEPEGIGSEGKDKGGVPCEVMIDDGNACGGQTGLDWSSRVLVQSVGRVCVGTTVRVCKNHVTRDIFIPDNVTRQGQPPTWSS